MQFSLVELRLISLLRGLLAGLHPIIQLIEMLARLGGERARPVHRRDDAKRILDAGEHIRHVYVMNDGASAFQLLACPFERIDGFWKCLVPIERSANADTNAFEFGGRRSWRNSGHDRLQHRKIMQVAGKQADRVETRTQMPDSAAINSRKARLEAENAANAAGRMVEPPVCEPTDIGTM